MSLLGMDLNASRARVVRGPLGDYPCTVPLESPRADLLLVLNVEGRTPVLGGTGLCVCRKTPQYVWQNFLPLLGELAQRGHGGTPAKGKLDASKAIGSVFHHILNVCRETDGVVMALPTYLSSPQVEAIQMLAEQAGWPVLGSLASPLAAALAAYAEQLWFGAAVVVDVDSQALTIATVGTEHGQAQLLDVRSLPQLNERNWRERLLNALADCCILDSRWDPRESPAGEQSLFDQIDDVLDAVQHGRMIKLTVQMPGRYQNLVLQSQDPAAFCANLRRQAIAEIASIFTAPWPEGAPGAILVTAAAARLPGLVSALQMAVHQWAPPKKRSQA